VKAIPLEAFGSRVSLDELVSPMLNTLNLERRVDGRLWASTRDTEQPVTVHRCFPWSDPTRFVSLRDEDGNEVGLVHNVLDLPSAMQAALMGEMAVAGFVLEIERVIAIEEEIEVRTWKVETIQGVRTMQTGRDEWPRELPGGGMVVKDVAGDLYHVTDVSKLDATSRKLLWALVD